MRFSSPTRKSRRQCRHGPYPLAISMWAGWPYPGDLRVARTISAVLVGIAATRIEFISFPLSEIRLPGACQVFIQGIFIHAPEPGYPKLAFKLRMEYERKNQPPPSSRKRHPMA